MIELYPGEAVARIDRATIEQAGIPGRVLMEQAGRAVAAAIRRRWPDRPVCVLAGKGNNGGDGYVAARWLRHFGFSVRVLTLAGVQELTGDAAWAARTWRAVGGDVLPVPVTTPTAGGEIAPEAVLVDAVFGTGFHGELRDPAASVFAALSRQVAADGNPVVAVDIPSGVDAATGAVASGILPADCTITMGLHKAGLWSWPGAGAAGALECVDLGYPNSIVRTETPVAYGLTLDDLPPLTRPAAGHKGTFGDVLICAGSVAMPGAAALCSRAALRAGAGRVLTCSEPAVLEAMPAEVIRVPVGDGWAAPSRELLECVGAADAAVVGPGWGRFDGERSWLDAILSARSDMPTVIDADGLRVLAEMEAHPLGSHVVLTPHPGEAAALLDMPVAELQASRLDAAARLVQRWGATVVLKGAGTIVAAPGQVPRILRVANPALAVPGSGDVLAGVVASCAVRGADVFEAASEAVLWHAAAARLLPPSGNVAGDLADLLATARPTVVT